MSCPRRFPPIMMNIWYTIYIYMHILNLYLRFVRLALARASRYNTIFQRIYGFEKSLSRTVLTCISYVLSIGWLRLLFHWYPRLHLYATHRKCTLNRATRILVIVSVLRYSYVSRVSSIDITIACN